MQIRISPAKYIIDKIVSDAKSKSMSSEVITRTDLIGATSEVSKDKIQAGYRISLMRKARTLKVAFRFRKWMFEDPLKLSKSQIELLEQMVIEKENGSEI